MTPAAVDGAIKTGAPEAPAEAPAAALDRLAACRDPFLIGVRHHSPACAAAIPALLQAAAPDRIYLELPPELGDWLGWLGHPAAIAPLALAAITPGGTAAFYPFADFSPELAVVRWARAHDVPVEAFDLPISARGAADEAGDAEEDAEAGAVLPHLLARAGVADGLALWDRLVEGSAIPGEPEATRRAALLYGWALRVDRRGDRESLRREAYMRGRLAAGRAAGVQRPVAVVGAFHAPALVGYDTAATEPTTGPAPTTSLIPYRFDLLDARSGYPAGVLDPGWHERAWAALRDGHGIIGVAAEVLVAISRDLRAAGHVAGPPDAAEALRVALALATLRGQAAPTRREIVEAVETTLGQGEPLGRGRVLAAALERVLVGVQRGRLAPGTPQSGLVPAVETLVAALRLPGPDDAGQKVIRLDPLRSDLDRRRHVALSRLAALDVPYGTCIDQAADTLTHAWQVAWEPATDAALALAGLYGADLAPAAEGQLHRDRPREDGEDAPPAEATLAWVAQAAECGLGGLVAEGLTELATGFAARAGLAALVQAVGLVDRIVHGHIPGLPEQGSPHGAPGAIAPFLSPPAAVMAVRGGLYAASVAALDGLAGSADPADARALTALVRLAHEEDRAADGRLGYAVDTLARGGTPRLAAAAAIARVALGRTSAAEAGHTLGAELDGATNEPARLALGERVAGFVEAAGVTLETTPGLLDGLVSVVDALPDAAFLVRLPALRHGFDGLAPDARERLLATLGGDDDAGRGAPDALAAGATADLAGRAAVAALGLLPREPTLASLTADGGTPAPLSDTAPAADPPGRQLTEAVRWRLILACDTDALPSHAVGYAAALDQLYGGGNSGGGGDLGGGALGGVGPGWPTAREWAGEIEVLFGAEVREEVIGRAAERGDAHALLLLDPETVTPSIHLLETALSLKGGLAEGQLVTLRWLCARVTEAVAHALAVRVRPALTGLSSPRPTRRHTDRLHLRRTVEANLRTARQGPEGVQLAPDRLYFRSRARRQMDWDVHLVVDTSGSMEASVIHAALMAAILAALPALTVSFYAFADEVIDFTDRVDDPLGLLLEVKVGGGTRIHRALRYTRERVRVPTRTIVVLVTDFEEGGSVAALVAEVRRLAEAGVRMIGLAALDEDAKPRFSAGIAAQVVAAGMPVAALTPLELARWLGEQLRAS